VTEHRKDPAPELGAWIRGENGATAAGTLFGLDRAGPAFRLAAGANRVTRRVWIRRIPMALKSGWDAFRFAMKFGW